MSGQASNPQNLNFALPDFSFHVFSFVELAFAVFIPILVYYLLRWLNKTLRNLGAVNRDTFTNKILNAISFIIPIFIFLFAFSDVAKGSFFISLLFFVVVSIVGAASAIDPIKAILGAIIINTKNDLKIGDQIHIGELKGRISNFGPFNITVETTSGSRVFIPNQQILKQSYEVHEKSGGPLITVEVEGEQSTENIEKLAQFCPYRRENSEIIVRQRNGNTMVSMEVHQRDVKPWVQQFFRNFLGKRVERRRF